MSFAPLALARLQSCSLRVLTALALTSLASCTLGETVDDAVEDLEEDIEDAIDELPDLPVEIGFDMLFERYHVADAFFEELTPPPTERNLFNVATDGEQVYVLGGVDGDGRNVRTLEAYDPATETWSSRAAWPDPGISYVLPLGDEICTLAGYEDLEEPLRNELWCYHPIEDTWRQGPSLPDTYSSTYPAVLDGRIYVLGGTTVTETSAIRPVDWARAYDPELDEWVELAPLPAPRGLMAVVPAQGRLHLVGGYDDYELDPLRETPEERLMLAYDPDGDEWSLAPQMPHSRWLFAADNVGDRVAVIMGLGNAPVVELFDPSTNLWTASPDPTQSLEGGVYSYAQHDGKIYLLSLANAVGGSGTDSTGKLWVHDVETGSWTIPARRGSDAVDGLLLGVGMGADLWYVGAMTEIRVQTLQRSPVGGSVQLTSWGPQ